ncbi:MAG: GntR family transcriptional regulator [Trebonia sp.]
MSRFAKERLLIDFAIPLLVLADRGLDHRCIRRLRLHGDSLPITMQESKIDPSDPTPLYLQVAAEIRRAIADGEASPGDRLPLARDLATVLGVNSNTVLRALRTLRDEGLLDFRRGRGITVIGTSQRGALLRRINELVDYARANGYRREELLTLLNDAPWPRASDT